MSAFLIEGGNPLSGTITPQGAKNEALQVICATLLTPGRVVIKNIPDTGRVRESGSAFMYDSGRKADFCHGTSRV